MEKLVIFKTDWCGHCREQVPQAVDIANRLGIQSEVVDINRCSGDQKSKCESVEYVPHMELNGREVSLEQLRERLSRR
jgi:thiol-disulfide isomerase/thioredoxin